MISTEFFTNLTFERCAGSQYIIDIFTLHKMNRAVGILIPLTFVNTFVTIFSKIKIINLYEKEKALSHVSLAQLPALKSLSISSCE